MQALEEPHRVEVTLTSSLATAYANYKNNLAALESYRKDILPDQVRAFRGIDERRRFDIQALSLTDLATAQQNLSTSVTTYLGILGQLWSSTVSVADLMDTDDLFQLADPRELPPLPDLEHLAPLPCSHPCARTPAAAPQWVSTAAPRPRMSCCLRCQSQPLAHSLFRPPPLLGHGLRPCPNRGLLPWRRLPARTRPGATRPPRARPSNHCCIHRLRTWGSPRRLLGGEPPIAHDMRGPGSVSHVDSS